MTDNIEALEEQLASATSIQQEIDAMNALAWASKRHNLQRVVKLSQDAHKLSTNGTFKGLPYKKGVIQSLRNLGWSNLALENYDQALVHLHEALSLAEELEASTETSQCHQLLADVYKQSGDFEKDYSFLSPHFQSCSNYTYNSETLELMR